MARARPHEIGIRLIVLYKAAKAVAELALSAAVAAVAASGEIEAVRSLAIALEENVASRWSVAAGRLLAVVATGRGVHLLELGLALDAVSSAIEGWSLWKGYRWGPWLVVVATAVPLPLEIRAILRVPRVSRALLVVVNVAVVVYLARRIAARRRARERSGPG